jgi:phosphoadenosine phosphosulfate reductase
MSIEVCEPTAVSTEPLSDSEIVCWNLEFPDLSPTERIEQLQSRLGSRVVAASSFGPTAPVLLKAISEVEPEIPVINVRHHHETPKTRHLVRWYATEFGLDLRTYDAPSIPLKGFGSEPFTEFQRKVKIEPFQRALEDHQALAYISGQMHWQSPSRAELPFVERRGTVAIVNAVVDIDKQTVENIFEITDWPRDEHYFDPTKGPDQKTECGLNTTRYELSGEGEQ